ncbi:MAG: PKD domain-containing protein, partial [Conexibacter sp.]
MPSARRLVLLALALGTLLGGSAVAGAAESCTTAVGPPLEGPLSDGLYDESCSAALLVVTPNPVDPGAIATFDGSGSVGADATADDIATYEWDFGDGTPLLQTAAPQSTTTHAYATRGRFVASLTIKDAGGVALAPSALVEVVVSALPIAALSGPTGVLRPGVEYAFDASGSSAPGGSIDHYVWNWGDGTPPETTASPNATHTFADDGASTAVSVTVVNDVELASAPDTLAIVVDNLVPVVQLLASPSTVAIGQTLTLSAAGSSDPDGAIAEYRWDLNGDGVYEHSTGLTPSVSAGGFPNAGILVLGVKVLDDSGDWATKTVAVTVTGSSSGGGGGDIGGGGGSTGGSTGGGGAGGG